MRAAFHRIRERVANVLYFLAIAYLLASLVYGWLYPTQDASAGDECGPHHHWQGVYGGISGSELSCESDEN